MIALRVCVLLALAAACAAAPAAPAARLFLKPLTLGCAPCRRGTVCAGPLWRKRCVVPMGAGQRCGVDPYWVCAAPLRCRRHVCVSRRLPVGASCLLKGSVCEDGTVCAGIGIRKKCVKPMGPGGRCGADPFWVCDAGLDCDDGKCVKPKVPRGGDCLPKGSVCEDGTVCAGTSMKKKCVKPMGPGGRCGADPFWVCDAGLDCDDGKCTKPKVPRGGDCLPEGSVCEDGTVCAGTSMKKKCVKPMGPGGRCGADPFWVCDAGLDCSDDGKCVKPKVPRGGDCLPEGSVCEDGTVCAGTSMKKKCVKPMGPGGRCGADPFWVCEAGLDCDDGKCTKPKVPRGGDCLPEGSVCEDGLFCLGGDGTKKCVEGMGAGEKCGLDPFWSCQPGLACVDRICKH